LLKPGSTLNIAVCFVNALTDHEHV